MSLHVPVSLLPLPLWRLAAWTHWRADALAGLAVAVFAVPQAMAYAILAGAGPVQGLYAAAVMAVVAALWGSSPWINSGPTNTASLLTAAALAPLVAGGGQLLPLLWTFSLLVGAIRLFMALLRLGNLMRFVPEPAFLGFMTAADILIALGQIHQFLGVPAPQGASTLGRLAQVLSRAPQTDLGTLGVGAGVVAVLWAFDRFSKRFPVALASVLTATLAAHFLARSGHPLRLVGDIAAIPVGLPGFQFYALDPGVLSALWVPALAVATIGLIEAASIGQAMALKKRGEVSFNREFLGQGLAQIVCGFVGGFPGSASFSRSALIERCGGKTALANVFFGVFTALAVLLAPRVLEQIPLSALAGLLLFTGFKLIETSAIRRVWRTSRADFGVFALTFAITFFGKIEWGFFAGVVAAMGVFLGHAAQLHLFELVPQNALAGRGRFEEIPYDDRAHHEPSGVVALAVHGDLFFGLAPDLRRRLNALARGQKPRFIVMRMRRAHSVDYSCWKALADFGEAFAQNGGCFILTGVRRELREVLDDPEMRQVFPDENLVAAGDSAWSAFEQGLILINARLQNEEELSAPWKTFFAALRPSENTKAGVSFGRDAANDPATWGVVEP